jgi:hypothetical protein
MKRSLSLLPIESSSISEEGSVVSKCCQNFEKGSDFNEIHIMHTLKVPQKPSGTSLSINV